MCQKCRQRQCNCAPINIQILQTNTIQGNPSHQGGYQYQGRSQHQGRNHSRSIDSRFYGVSPQVSLFIQFYFNKTILKYREFKKNLSFIEKLSFRSKHLLIKIFTEYNQRAQPKSTSQPFKLQSVYCRFDSLATTVAQQQQ